QLELVGGKSDQLQELDPAERARQTDQAGVDGYRGRGYGGFGIQPDRSPEVDVVAVGEVMAGLPHASGEGGEEVARPVRKLVVVSAQAQRQLEAPAAHMGIG